MKPRSRVEPPYPADGPRSWSPTPPEGSREPGVLPEGRRPAHNHQTLEKPERPETSGRAHLQLSNLPEGRRRSKEGHREGQPHHHHVSKGPITAGEPEATRQAACQRESSSCDVPEAHDPPRREGCTAVRNQPKRAPRGHATGMPSPSDKSPPKQTPTKGQDKSLIPYTPKDARKPHPGPKSTAPPPRHPKVHEGSVESHQRYLVSGAMPPPEGCVIALKETGEPLWRLRG